MRGLLKLTSYASNFALEGFNVDKSIDAYQMPIDKSSMLSLWVRNSIAFNEEERVDEPVKKTFTKMTTGLPSNGGLELKLALERFSDQLSPANAIQMLHVIYNIHKRILDEPNVDKHYRIYTKSNIFHNYVWRWEEAQEYLLYMGWVMCGDFLVLSKSQPVHLIVKVIEDVFRKNKKVQLLYSGSITSSPHHHHPHDVIDGKRTSKLVEDEYTDIEAPQERDSAIGSGMDDDDEIDIKPTQVLNVQSKEHNMGDENYIVVDFVSDESKLTSEQILDSSELDRTKSSEIIVDNSSPFTSVKIPQKSESFTFEIEDDRPIDDVGVSVFLNDSGVVNNDVVISDANTIKTEVIDIEVKVEKQQTVIFEATSKPCDVNNVCEDVGVTATVTGKEVTPLPPRASGKRKVFSAGGGLKKAKEEKMKAEEIKIVKKKVEQQEELPSSDRPLLQKKSQSPLHSAPVRKTSPSASVTSLDSSRPGSFRSANNDSPSASLVKQNAMLFDQQIANELKNRPSPRQSFGKASLNGLELDRSDSGELNLSGIVAGARSKFEVEGGGRSRTDIRRNSSNISAKRAFSPSRENVVLKVEQTVELQPPKPQDPEVVVPPVPNASAEIGLDTAKKQKKKKFPFKKAKYKEKETKKKRSGSVELIGAESNQPYEERAIDIGSIPPETNGVVIVEVELPVFQNGIHKEHIDISDVLCVQAHVESVESAPVLSELKPIKNEIESVKLDIKPVKTEIIPVKPEITPVKPEITPVKTDIKPIQTEIAAVKTEITQKEIEIAPVKTDVAPVNNNITPDKIEAVPVKSVVKSAKPQEYAMTVETPVLSATSPVKPSKSEPTPPVSAELPNTIPESPSINTDLSRGGMQRTKSKKRRLAKVRKASTLSNTELFSDETEEFDSDKVVCGTNIDTSETFVTGTLVNDIPESQQDELFIHEVVKKDDTEIQLNFENVSDLSCEEIKQPIVVMDTVTVDIDSLQNESSIDDVVITTEGQDTNEPEKGPGTTNNGINFNPIGTSEHISVRIDSPDNGDTSSIAEDALSDATGSFYDGDNVSMTSLNDDPNDGSVKKKKKKKLPKFLKFGKKNKDKKDKNNELAVSSPSPDQVFVEDNVSQSSFKLKFGKKKGSKYSSVESLQDKKVKNIELSVEDNVSQSSFKLKFGKKKGSKYSSEESLQDKTSTLSVSSIDSLPLSAKSPTLSQKSSKSTKSTISSKPSKNKRLGLAFPKKKKHDSTVSTSSIPEVRDYTNGNDHLNGRSNDHTPAAVKHENLI